MTKAAEMARVSAKGGFHVLWGLVASTVISSVGTIVIAGLLGDGDYGLYTIAINAPNLIATFRDWGMNNAMIKYTAQYNNNSDTSKIRSIFLSGLIFEIALGLILSAVSFFLSDTLAGIFARPQIGTLIQMASFIVLTGALINAATAAFTGLERMHLNSIMLIVQSIVKTSLVIGLVLFFRTFSPDLAKLGATAGFTASALVAGLTGILLMWTMYKTLPKPTNGKLELSNTTRTMLKYGLPLSIGVILTGFLTQFFNWMMNIFVKADATIGSYGVALNFVVLITFFATPVTTMLFPAFSKIDYRKDHETLKNVFQYSVKYSAFIVVPVTAMVIALAQPAINTIFENRYVEAPLFLALLSITYLYSALGNLSAGNLINGQGQTTFVLKLNVLTAAVGFPIGFLLISQFGVIGLIVTTLTAGLPSLVVSLYFIKKQYGVSLDWISSAKILFTSVVSAVSTFAIISQLPFASVIKLVIGVLIFAVVFLTVALLTRTITRADVVFMREIIGGLGPLRRILNTLLNFLEKLMTTLHA